MGEFCESEVEKGVFFSFPFREITIGGKSCKGGGRMPRATACLILLCDKNLALVYLPGRRGEILVFMFLIAEAFFSFRSLLFTKLVCRIQGPQRGLISKMYFIQV